MGEQVELVLLHGYDSRPGAMLPLAESLSAVYPDCDKRLLTGPVWLGGSENRSFAWWDETHSEFPTEREATHWLATHIQKPSVLIGFSQGAALALTAAMTGVENIVGVVSIGGFLPDDVEVVPFAGSLLVLHGEADERVDAMYATRLHRQALKAGTNSTIELHDGGHKIPADISSVTQFLKEWL
jgi:predicted esterase